MSRRSLLLSLALASAAGGLALAADPPAAPFHLAGAPVSAEMLEVVRTDWFEVGYSHTRHAPLWAAYHLGKRLPEVPRWPSRHGSDPFDGINSRYYQGSGYDEGQLVPRWAMLSRYGLKAAQATYTHANVVPQLAGLDGGFWNTLELWIAGTPDGSQPGWAETRGEVWVELGPVYDEQPKLLPRGKVPVPSAFWCVVAAKGPELLAFLVPNAEAFPDPYLTNVDEIEARTGLDLFPDLPDDVEQRLEKQTAPARWK